MLSQCVFMELYISLHHERDHQGGIRMNIQDRWKEIIQDALKVGVDPIESILEYMNEKDSRMTRQEAMEIVRRLKPLISDKNGDEHDTQAD